MQNQRYIINANIYTYMRVENTHTYVTLYNQTLTTRKKYYKTQHGDTLRKS